MAWNYFCKNFILLTVVVAMHNFFTFLIPGEKKIFTSVISLKWLLPSTANFISAPVEDIFSPTKKDIKAF